jgi:flagellar motor switch protein FliG
MNAPLLEDYDLQARPLTGAQKVAALLLCMGKPMAGRLLRHFDEIETRDVVRAAAQLGTVSRTTVELLIDEFSEDFSAGADLQGNVGEVQQLLNEALPAEKAADILSDVFGSSNSGLWERLTSLPDVSIAAFLQAEHPQTSAFMLSKIGSGHAAAVLSRLPRELRNDILRRMIALGPVSDEALRIVETAIQSRLMNTAGRGSGKDTCARVAEIVNQFEPADVEDVIQSLSEQRPTDAAALKKMLFSFDDLLRLSARARSVVFDGLPTDVIVLALRGTDSSFRDAVLSSMASRARRLVESELSSGASAPQRDVIKARRAIVDTVLKMAQRNEIELSPSDDSEAV